ncbi:MAG: hypothetical protein Q8T09_03835 [Candidatus Melainabacteria bacterium]|nr:hypothetical protein [Candidatus Melainabacteria bacterium]
MLHRRSSHAVTLLQDGVLITGGGAGGGRPWRHSRLRQAQIFDPSLNAIVAAGLMSKPRENHEALLLNNGKVLVVGGRTANTFSDAGDSLISVVELYDVNTFVFIFVGRLHYAREAPEVAPLGAGGAVVCLGETDVFRDVALSNRIALVEYCDGTKTHRAKSVAHTASVDEVLYCLFNIGRK